MLGEPEDTLIKREWIMAEPELYLDWLRNVIPDYCQESTWFQESEAGVTILDTRLVA